MVDPLNPLPRTEEEDTAQFTRIPGLHRRWEIQQVLEPGCVLHIEEAGEDADGTPLYAVFKQEPERVQP